MFPGLLLWLLAITIAITVHEFAHAYIADKLGDPTARLHGRLSLNPLKHYDPVGTTMLIVSAVFFGFPFGWAKPVPMDPYNLANPRKDAGLIALAGPAVNLIFASLLALAIRFFLIEIPLLNIIALYTIIVNVALAVFNLIPVHPLDGSKVLSAVLPQNLAHEYQSVMSRYGLLILLLLIFPLGGVSPISSIILPLLRFFLNILGLLSGTPLGQSI